MTLGLAVLRFTKLPAILSWGLWAIATSWVFLTSDLDLDLIVKSETGFGFRNIKSAHLWYTVVTYNKQGYFWRNKNRMNTKIQWTVRVALRLLQFRDVKYHGHGRTKTTGDQTTENETTENETTETTEPLSQKPLKTKRKRRKHASTGIDQHMLHELHKNRILVHVPRIAQ